MRNGAFFLSALLGVTVTVRAATADAGNPYHSVITGRNVFALKSPPPPPDPESLKPPPAKVTLIGIVNAFGTRKAVLKSAEARPAAPGQPPAQEEAIVLREWSESNNESQQGIKVLAIDEAAGTVKIDNNGQVDTLNFEKNGVKAPSGPATAPVGVPGPGGIPRPGMPGGLPMRPGMPMPAGGMPGAIGAPPVSALGTAAGTGLAGTTDANGLPARNLRGPTAAEPLSLEEQTIMVEANREMTRNQVQQGLLPPLPPTALTSEQDLQTLVTPITPNINPGAVTPPVRVNRGRSGLPVPGGL